MLSRLSLLSKINRFPVQRIPITPYKCFLQQPHLATKPTNLLTIRYFTNQNSPSEQILIDSEKKIQETENSFVDDFIDELEKGVEEKVLDTNNKNKLIKTIKSPNRIRVSWGGEIPKEFDIFEETKSLFGPNASYSIGSYNNIVFVNFKDAKSAVLAPKFTVVKGFRVKCHLVTESLDPLHSISNEQIDKLPIGEFSGKIHIVYKENQVLPAILDLLNNKTPSDIKSPENQVILGFDAEWKPESDPNKKKSKVSVVQLSNEHTAAIFQLKNLGTMPKILEELLTNENILKVGVGSDQDQIKLLNHFQVQMKGVKGPNDFGFFHTIKPKSLLGLTALLCGFRMPKKRAITMSNWERKILTDEQIKYAALDAWCSREVYLRLKEIVYDEKKFSLNIPELKPVVNISILKK